MTANLINYWRHTEDRRHNLASEQETYRHNTEVEAYNRAALAESSRHNLAVETEAHRSNVARELETHRSNVAYEQENHRHNLAVEGETKRHNMVTEAETERSNRANERLKGESNQIGWANVSLGRQQLAEAERHNRAQEETTRAYNSAMVEYYNTKSDRDYSIAQGNLANAVDRTSEDKRHNLETEDLARDRFTADTIYEGLNVGAKYIDAFLPG